ncbi:S-layer homology domain-containing protein [Kovacikia minuta CCNUW1]|uniref:S-layer homology domain-containing protein n=1 Tax=Kovacikia minuta TaxID=2931930 RepID=UPI001CCD8304|nr:S-layer homology domain-containing protein [Kovacikia minuta CCNUW1]
MIPSSPRFPDIQTHWAKPFVEALAARGMVRGFEDQTFRPNRAVSRAEFAALLQTAFPSPAKRPYTPFADVPANHWAAIAIRKALRNWISVRLSESQVSPGGVHSQGASTGFAGRGLRI